MAGTGFSGVWEPISGSPLLRSLASRLDRGCFALKRGSFELLGPGDASGCDGTRLPHAFPSPGVHHYPSDLFLYALTTLYQSPQWKNGSVRTCMQAACKGIIASENTATVKTYQGMPAGGR